MLTVLKEVVEWVVFIGILLVFGLLARAAIMSIATWIRDARRRRRGWEPPPM